MEQLDKLFKGFAEAYSRTPEQEALELVQAIHSQLTDRGKGNLSLFEQCVYVECEKIIDRKNKRDGK